MYPVLRPHIVDVNGMEEEGHDPVDDDWEEEREVEVRDEGDE